MVNAGVRAKLIEVAKAKKTISYSELGQAGDLSLDGNDDMKGLGFALDEIADAEIAAGRPFLPVVVVSGKTGFPGAGLFKYAKRKKIYKGDDVTFFATELKRVYEFWATADPAT